MRGLLNWTQTASLLDVSPERVLRLMEKNILPVEVVIDGAKFWSKEKVLAVKARGLQL